MIDEWLRDHGFEALGAAVAVTGTWFGMTHKVTAVQREQKRLIAEHAAFARGQTSMRERVARVEGEHRALKETLLLLTEGSRRSEERLVMAMGEVGDRMERKIDEVAERLGTDLRDQRERTDLLAERLSAIEGQRS